MNIKLISILLSGTLLTLSILFLTGCETNGKVTEYPVTLEQVLTETNERNQSVIENFKVDDISDYCFDVDLGEYTEDELESLFASGHMSNVKPEKAREDIDVLFRLLEGSYAGYAYFGGAGAFDRAKTDMLSEIASYGDNRITAADFTKFIRDNLNFVIDDHLIIGSVKTGFEEAYCWYDSNLYEFHRDSKGYYSVIDDQKWYLPENMIDYLKYTIGKSGEIVYGLFYVGTGAERERLPAQMTLSDKYKGKSIEIKWEKSVSPRRLYEEYRLKDTDGIKTATIAAFLATPNTNRMINDAKELAKEDYAIVDLKYNQGGLSTDVIMWMYNFSGKEVYPKASTIAYESTINNYWHGLMKTDLLAAYQTFDFFKENREFVNNLFNNKPEAFTVTDVGKGVKRIDIKANWIQRAGKVLFVLNGKENISGGEYFIEDCRSLENTLVVGTNSGGCLTTADVNVFYLPNSHISIMYGSQLVLFDRLNNFDTYGILPDIYIGTGNEAEAVAKCIRYYQ